MVTVRTGMKLQAALLAVLALSGCASRLEVVVDVYQGPLVEPRNTRLETAEGQARDLYAQVKRSKLEAYKDTQALGKEVFQDEHAFPADMPVGSADRETAQQRAQQLVRFCRATAQAAQVAGYAEIANRWPLQSRSAVTEAVAIEQSAHHAAVIAESVIDELASDFNEPRLLVKTRQILKSQSHGTLLESVTDLYFFGEVIGRNAEKAYNRKYWAEVNRVPVELPTDATVLIVKDEIGNYQIRQLDIDPSTVIEAIQNLIQEVLTQLAEFGIMAI